MEKLKAWLLVWWPWLTLGAVVLLSGGVVVAYTQRGLRNNNPGNIKKNGTAWEGLSPTQADPIFFQFTQPYYGLRALARNLVTNQTRRGLATVNQLIADPQLGWAPPVENNSSEYVRFVASKMGVDANQTVTLNRDPALLGKMVTAIVTMENGIQPFDQTLIARASASAIAAGA